MRSLEWQSVHTDTHTHSPNLPTLLKRENTCIHTKLYNTFKPPTPLRKAFRKKKALDTGLQHLLCPSLFFSVPWPTTSPIYLLHPCIPWNRVSLLSQHALQLTAVVEASDPCTRPWSLSNSQSPLSGSLLHLHTENSCRCIKLRPEFIHTALFTNILMVKNRLLILCVTIPYGFFEISKRSVDTVPENTASLDNIWTDIINTLNNCFLWGWFSTGGNAIMAIWKVITSIIQLLARLGWDVW